MSDLASPSLIPLLIVLAIVAIAILLGSIRMAQEYQRAVIFRFGRVVGTRGPGLFLKVPLAERAVLVDLRTITRELETQETVTRDGVAVEVNAVLWYQAADPVKAVVNVADWKEAVKQAAETAMRDTIGQNELDHLLQDRLNANLDLKRLLAAAVQKWGVEISAVELKDLDIPETMQRAIAREAEAIREKRARIIKAEGEMEAASKLNEAAEIISRNPAALELRRLQALTEIGAEHNSVIIVAMPTESSTPAAAAIAKAVAATANGTRVPNA
ncbi:MAG: slipin family protein [Acetobacteraceae bacterium]|nr:slipin family protein [Acetobacteraceae bacterium]